MAPPARSLQRAGTRRARLQHRHHARSAALAGRSWRRRPIVKEGPDRRPVTSQVLLGTAMVLLAMNMRPAAAAIGPLIHRIRADSGLSGTGAGLLVALPVLCFGGLAPVAPILARR